jgi:flagellar P-ring protein precursor FlgI
MRKFVLLMGFLGSVFGSGPVIGAQIRNIASLRGVRNNQLLGYGIVIGLAGTGDKSLDLSDISIDESAKSSGVESHGRILAKNAAAVVCSCILPPFAKAGSKFEVTLSSIGSATSLEGGILLTTPLRGTDGKTYALARGRVKLFNAEPDRRGLLLPLSATSARVSDGALLEKDVGLEFVNNREITYLLHSPDFTTASRIAWRINEELSGKYASAVDASTIEVSFPYHYDGNPVDLLGQIENIEVDLERIPRIILNRRTGHVVMGEHAQVAPVAISPRGWHVEVKDEHPPWRTEAPHDPAAPPGGTTVADIIALLNALGANASDLVAVLQSLKTSGALQADVEVQ